MQLIRPWPTREAYDRFMAEVEDLADGDPQIIVKLR